MTRLAPGSAMNSSADDVPRPKLSSSSLVRDARRILRVRANHAIATHRALPHQGALG